jgi:hypothetical protein
LLKALLNLFIFVLILSDYERLQLARLQQQGYANRLHQIHIRQQREQEERRRHRLFADNNANINFPRTSPRSNKGVPPLRYGYPY